MSHKYQSQDPNNARIYIDYSNKENPVRFQYPVKQSQFKIVFISIFGMWITLNIWFLFLPWFALSTFGVNLPSWSLTAFVLQTFATPLILSIIFTANKQLLSIMPKLNKFSSTFPFGTHYYKKINKLDSLVFEIPSLANIFLDYKAVGEFSKYLERVEVTEIPFKVIKRSIFRRKGKLIKQDREWQAKFYFKEKPQRGALEVWFK